MHVVMHTHTTQTIRGGVIYLVDVSIVTDSSLLAKTFPGYGDPMPTRDPLVNHLEPLL